MHVAAYSSHRDNAPRTADVTWEQLAALLTRHTETQCAPCVGHDCPAKVGPAWSPVEIAGSRRNENVRSLSALALDFDGITTDQARQVAVALHPFAYVAHTSHSHAALSAEGKHAFRAVVQLSRPVPAAEWRAFRAAAVAMLGVPTDPSCKDLSRLYFLPSTPAGGAHWTARREGPPLDVDRVLADAPRFLVVGGQHHGAGRVHEGGSEGHEGRGLGAVRRDPEVQAAGLPRASERSLPVPGGGGAGGAGDGLSPGPVDLDEIRKRIRQASNVLAPLILAGKPLAGPGGRDAALNAAASFLAFTAPPGTPAEALFEVLRPSLGAMDLEPEGFEHWVAELMNPHDGMIPRALRRRAEQDARREVAHQALLAEVFGESAPVSPGVPGVMSSGGPTGPNAGPREWSSGGPVTGPNAGPSVVQDPTVPVMPPPSPGPVPGEGGGPAIPGPGSGDLALDLLASPAPPGGPPEDDPPPGGGAPWSASLKWNRDKDGSPVGLKNAASNVGAILLHDRAWSGALRFNSLSGQVELWGGPVRPPDGDFPVPLTDELVTRIRNWFAQRPEVALQVDVSSVVMYEQIQAAARANSYDPVRDYLDGAGEWDGVSRIDSWLETYLGAQLVDGAGADITEYVRAVGAKWLIAAVARTYEPGCQVQNVLILEGEQGLGATGLRGKSSALAALASREFFTGTAIDIRSPNAPMMTTRTWIVELAELDSLSRSNETAQKEFFSRDWEEFRPPYGRVVVKRPRRCIFAGTGNRSDYLSDDTGNRRYWPVAVTRADVAGIERDRDQLWAEARERYLAGKAEGTECLWWLTPEEELIARTVTDERMAPDDWEDAIWRWWTGPGGKKRDVRTLDVATSALGVTSEKTDRRTQQRIGRAMKRLGFARKRKREGARLVWFYEPGPSIAPMEAAPGAVVVPIRSAAPGGGVVDTGDAFGLL